jgi:hypothetical protein
MVKIEPTGLFPKRYVSPHVSFQIPKDFVSAKPFLGLG